MSTTDDKELSRQAGSCDIRVWCGDCKTTDYVYEGDKYLCVTCRSIMNLDHEVRHEVFPHVTGDTDNLS